MSEIKKPHPLCVEFAIVGSGYYGAHIRGRIEGLADHLEEAKKLVKQAIKDGLTFEMLEEDFRVFSKGTYDYSKDEYAQKLKQLFNEEVRRFQ